MAGAAVYAGTDRHGNGRLIETMMAWKNFAQKTRVPLGIVTGIVFIILMRPTPGSLWVGCGIALAGALIRLWAAGHIDKGVALTRGGPYAFSRNPLYFGSFIMALGIIAAGGEYRLLLPFMIFFALFYVPVMRAEEQGLQRVFGDAFVEYSRQVPLFFPSLKATNCRASTFSWSRVVRNREHRNITAFFIIIVILIFRMQ
ncbi:MAG TPA: isoprenylcysteine carboxylmethyltransferase family protein [Acidobacteriota bacterium]|nr:isoprenylcysteine carboxylmethyltransferase family protein [Acidobacteriota bacterium]